MTESKTGMSFSRRNFIKGAAALTATGALVGCAPAKETLAETGEEPVEVPEPRVRSYLPEGPCPACSRVQLRASAVPHASRGRTRKRGVRAYHLG